MDIVLDSDSECVTKTWSQILGSDPECHKDIVLDHRLRFWF
jgi:hypothetical protein